MDEYKNTAWMSGKNFTLTGGFTDEELERTAGIISASGGNLLGDTRPDTDYVIWEERIYGSTVKLKRAREYNGHGLSMVIYTQEEFYHLLAGEAVAPSAKQSSSKITHIAPYMASHDPAYVAAYLAEHNFATPANQEVLLALVKHYNRFTVKEQRKWYDLIASAEGLKFSLYESAVRYFCRIAEYDTAEGVCNLAERACVTGSAENTFEIKDKIEDLRVDVDFYRGKPYWPALTVLKKELAEIYDSKGIDHPSLTPARRERSTAAKEKPAATTEKPAAITISGLTAYLDGHPGAREVTLDSGYRLRMLKEEEIENVSAKLDALDYTSDEDGKYANFAGANCFNIRHVGTQTVSTLIDCGYVESFAGIFRLRRHRGEMLERKLFTEAKLDAILEGIDNSREISEEKLLLSLAVPHLTEPAARKLAKEMTVDELLQLGRNHGTLYDIAEIVGPYASASVILWFENEANTDMLRDLLKEIRIKEPEAVGGEKRCEGKIFVITGDVHIFKNRNEVKDYIFAQGGKWVDSVSKKTDYLITNDKESNTGKSKKARELNIPVISEDEFVERFGFPET